MLSRGLSIGNNGSYYCGFINLRNQKKEGTDVLYLVNMAETGTDFVEADIEVEIQAIFDIFVDDLKTNQLITD